MILPRASTHLNLVLDGKYFMFKINWKVIASQSEFFRLSRYPHMGAPYAPTYFPM